MTSGRESQRKREIRASRARLTHALTAAGLRTQAALAERIADLEGLESAPRDLVNRAFRELPVELQSLERTGRNEEAIALYEEVIADHPRDCDLPRLRRPARSGGAEIVAPMACLDADTASGHLSESA